MKITGHLDIQILQGQQFNLSLNVFKPTTQRQTIKMIKAIYED